MLHPMRGTWIIVIAFFFLIYKTVTLLQLLFAVLKTIKKIKNKLIKKRLNIIRILFDYNKYIF